MAKRRQLYSIQRQMPRGEWMTLTGFRRTPHGEALGAIRMADAHYGGPLFRMIEDGPDGIGAVIQEGGGRGSPTVEGGRRQERAE